jgi:hypothetical protein
MKSWLYASAVAAALVIGVSSGFAHPRPSSQLKHVANEVALAGLRPGKDTLAAAEKRYKTKYLRSKTKAAEDKDKSDEAKEKNQDGKDKSPNAKDKTDDTREWLDDCRGRSLRLELDAKGIIQSVTISAMAPRDGDCKDKPGDYLNAGSWMTGRGLRLGDPRDRIIEIYGEPDSSGPSVKGARELELLFYAFDWAGSDVPQVLEVSCERSTGRVLEITLAFPSL